MSILYLVIPDLVTEPLVSNPDSPAHLPPFPAPLYFHLPIREAEDQWPVWRPAVPGIPPRCVGQASPRREGIQSAVRSREHHRFCPAPRRRVAGPSSCFPTS